MGKLAPNAAPGRVTTRNHHPLVARLPELHGRSPNDPAGRLPPRSPFGAKAVRRSVRSTETGADCTDWFPEHWAGLGELSGGPQVIDGEACVLREDGNSDFDAFQERAGR